MVDRECPPAFLFVPSAPTGGSVIFLPDALSIFPAMLMFKALPVEPEVLAPEALMLASDPVKLVIAPGSSTSRKEPTVAPAVVIPVALDPMLTLVPEVRELASDTKAIPVAVASEM